MLPNNLALTSNVKAFFRQEGTVGEVVFHIRLGSTLFLTLEVRRYPQGRPSHFPPLCLGIQPCTIFLPLRSRRQRTIDLSSGLREV